MRHLYYSLYHMLSLSRQLHRLQCWILLRCSKFQLLEMHIKLQDMQLVTEMLELLSRIQS